MGLPVWRAPSPEANNATKVDPSASARSPIRRRSPFAGRRARSSRSPRSPRLLDPEYLATVSHADPIPRPLSGRRSAAPPAAPELLQIPRAEIWTTGIERYHHPAESTEDDERFANAMRLRRDTIYRTMYDSNASSGHRDALRLNGHLAALTPNFAPAAASRNARADATVDRIRERYLSSRRSPWDPARSHHPMSGSLLPENIIIIEDADDDNDSNAVGFPPLRRMGRRTIADGPLPSSSLRESWSPATTLDGLGDRERSMSPIDDHWDTMLSTVAPDPVAPSADSSFTSAAASASFSNSHPSSRAGSSNSNSATSSRTHLTIPSRRGSPPNEVFMRACDTSDDDTASDTEEEEDTTSRLHRSSLRRRSRQGYADEPPSRDPNRYSRGVRDRSREASAYVRGFYGTTSRDAAHPPEQLLDDHADGHLEPFADAESQTLDQELRDARAILERIAQRDDVSDDFWASVGLARTLADRVERLQQRERL